MSLKWTICKTGSDLYDEKPLISSSWIAVFDSVEVQAVNGVFVTTGGVLTHSISYPERQRVYTNKYKVSEIELNPDFEALGAFRINLPDGTRVFVEEAPGVRYVWENGKIVPDVNGPTFDEIDKAFEEGQ